MASKFFILTTLVALASASHSHLHVPLPYSGHLSYGTPLISNVVEKIGVRYSAPQVVSETYTPGQTYSLPTTKIFRADPDVHEYSTHNETKPGFTKRIITYQQPIVHETVSPPIVQKSYESVPVAPLVQETIVEPIVPIAPLEPIVPEIVEPIIPVVQETYAAPIAPIVEPLVPIVAPLANSYAASAPVLQQAYVAPILEPLPPIAPVVEKFVQPIAPLVEELAPVARIVDAPYAPAFK